ncbi:hypothetical protein EN871_29335 [bacterium M00.F.Ca.ET.228.01.1.1]|uniref:hypothetical protein n=1 Tax=Paraburkholderia phenoliruptrix TaxID=252970 RepID=UPI001093273A|nr:hypothetical protein [Paraburkholderia phenoliruptrix]TGP40085.1 hypothetical protein EN871_29335 [bacterium M00.F.Ca.ET.228.01.1.1]TGR96060.1 hypothetical protein EN834_28940 [bacterium M00.F.Ca.ET.191.01.1.1]TGT97197.1 hypothetical protein EN798_28950 [bacterium M00.F.Ca.ET.155.01.1.1]MBW0448466.1 hypothetical protein [Paraburkholderia phenoliruptrix]MBW9100672.1 hypothetical protein [Paraburkholderia phenoliruptrix]
MNSRLGFGSGRLQPLWLAAVILAATQLAACGNGDDVHTVQSTTQAGKLLVVNGDGSVASCAIDAKGMPGQCSSTTAGDTGRGAANVAVFASHAYVTNLATNSVHVCPVDNVDPQNNCTNYGSDAALVQPLGVAFNGNRGYFVNANNTVAFCQVGGDGALSACVSQDGGGVFNGANGIAIQNNLAYVTNQANDTVATCKVGADGSLGSCSASGSNLSAPTGIALTARYAYVTNTGNSSLSVCPINGDGSLGACSQLSGDGAFNIPSSITINGNVAYITNFGDDTIAICAVNGASVTDCSAGSADQVFFQTTGSAFVAVKS